ncbi:threonine ammonia-lyase [Deinococcus roseus]|uniref:Threonine ammonia-lyase n=1 Tax=Deinococcus roseus TaxID=392414 RepID=A0ABQ2CXI3_9DEIO|nr:threonine/serine dehydratase [Deinococcus roseus]GGJ30946.1 threonine ammonia-lyase [Deinococcus roseus]
METVALPSPADLQEHWPSFHEILHARQVISRHLFRTPLISHPALNQWLGTPCLIKHENTHLTGAFKVRGGLYLLSQMDPAELKRGVISYSTGNHGQSVAYAAHCHGVKATIVMPAEANPLKVRAMQNLGAEVVLYGARFDDARAHAEHLAKQHGYHMIQAANEPRIIAGVGTIALEMLEEAPDLQVILVAVGGGSSAAGTCLAVKTLKPTCQVIAVQAAASPAAYLSWKHRELLTASNETFAEGLATGAGYALTQSIMQACLTDFVLVSDDEIRTAMHHCLTDAHTLAEGAGAAALAGARQLREQLQGKKIGVILSGGNTSLEHLKAVLH